MGEYADLTIDQTIDGWDGSSHAHYGLSPIALKEPKKCNNCGYGWLFWRRHKGKWKLHHWTLLPGEKKPKFVLHRCGFTSDGKPKEKKP